MQRLSRLRSLPVLAALVGVLCLTGCQVVVLGHPDAGASPQGNVRVGDVNIVGAAGGPIDTLARNALSDLESYWSAQFPKVFGKDFTPLQGGYFSVDPGNVDPADFPQGVGCGSQPLEVEGNAFYCQAPDTPNSDSITYDRSFLAELADGYGRFIPALVMAHEFGHAVQARVGSPQSSIAVETQADCLAGAWTAWVADGKAAHSRIREPELDQLLRGYYLLRDPVGTGTAAQSAHGSFFDRVSAFQEGFDSGPVACRDDFGPDRVFTQGEFTSDVDFQTHGNAPFNTLHRLVVASLTQFWNRAFTEVFDASFRAPSVDAFQGSPPHCAPGDRDLVYCPGNGKDAVVGYDDRDLARPAYDQLGDFAVATAVAIPYALAGRDQLDLSTDDAAAYRSAVCLAGWYGAQVYNHQLTDIQISPGDIDESVAFLLSYGDDPKVLGAADRTGFQLVDLFRGGFVEGASACDVGA